MAYSDVAIDLSSPSASQEGFLAMSPTMDELDYGDAQSRGMSRSGSGLTGLMRRNETDKTLLWAAENAEADDYLHDPNPELDKYLDKQMQHWSLAGLINTLSLAAIVIVLVGLFGGWPIYNYAINGGFPDGASQYANQIDSSGTVPNMALPTLVDPTTPNFAKTRTGFDGQDYELVFSDEFNTSGRTFWAGDDPYWEAVDLHYWATTDLEWYDPDAIITKDGYLQITMSEQANHDLNFRSGMLQSWNKFCFTGGYIEFGAILPGTVHSQGFWSALWTMGNLGRPGYGGSVDGMWPYSYDTCDVGTLPNQTYPNGTAPALAKSSGSTDYGGELSYLVGQRASACTCSADSGEHPGPSVGVGRGAPEIDVLEAQISYPSSGAIGAASQSTQVAPFDAAYTWGNSTPNTLMYNENITFQNNWHGSISQESMSVYTYTDTTSYVDGGATQTTYGMEYHPGGGTDANITWAVNGTETWSMLAAAMGPNEGTEIGQRLVSEEPMAIIMNLALSTKAQEPLYQYLTFPATFKVDYVRVYQQKGKYNVGCNPKAFPTTDYINNHLDLYMNNNLTTFAQSNYTTPRNSMGATGCN